MKAPGIERIFVAFVIVATVGIIAAHAADVVVRASAPLFAAAGAGAFAVAVCVSLLAAALAAWRLRRPVAALIAGVTTSVAAAFVLCATSGADSIPVVLVGAGAGGGYALSRLARRLPASIDAALRRRRVAAIAWALLGLATVVQTARLSTYMADPTSNWVLTTTNEFWSRHMCMQAYFYAADLNRRGEPNVYAAEHYPGLDPDAETHTAVAHLQADDPYQYPPQFLLLPRLALAASNDFHVIRSVWFAVQALGFMLAAFILARWYGGAAGRLALWLIPVVWLSVPSMLNFQYGQFHVSTIALAAGAVVAFDRRWRSLGGALLAASILAKGFPGILLVPLLLQRRWKEAGSTLAWAAGLTVAAWAVIGWEPFAAFFQYHLPRVRSGEAFAFHEAWPDFAAPLLAGNVSVYSLVLKLRELGVAGANEWAARAAHGVFSFGVLALAALAARVQDRRGRALVWMGLITLASMTSPAAWGDYVPVAAVWLATFLVPSVLRGGIRGACILVAAATSIVLPGVVPIGNFPGAELSMVMSIGYTLLLITFSTWVVLRAAPERARAAIAPLYRTEPATARPV